MNVTEFADAYAAGYPKTVRFLRSRGITIEPEEIAQAAWVRGWEQRGQIRDTSALPIWVNSIAMNLYRAQLRHDRRCEHKVHETAVEPANVIAVVEVARRLQECSEQQRYVLEQYYLNGNEVQDIAAKCGCSELAIRLRLLRARRKISEVRAARRSATN